MTDGIDATFGQVGCHFAELFGREIFAGSACADSDVVIDGVENSGVFG